jgi:sarcosine oxidase subunit gamma
MSNDFSMMDQIPANGEQSPQAQSPLFHVGFTEMAAQAQSESGVYLQEHALLSHLVLRGDPQNEAFKQGVEEVLGLALPERLSHCANDALSITWISPDEWLVIVADDQAFATEQDLREALSGHYAIVNVSGGQTLLELSGEKATQVLMKSTVYDVHDSHFPVGKAVTTVFAKTQAVIIRKAPDCWQLVVRRSFSDYIWLWLQDSCAEFGLVIKT